MTFFPINNPYQIFTDENGDPLEAGFVWIGEAYQNPITNPINIYWDRSFLYPAAQPIRTSGGYAQNNSHSGNIYVNPISENYSIIVQDKTGRNIFHSKSETLGSITGFSAIDARLFGAKGDGTSDDSAAWQAVQDYAFSLTSPIIGHNDAPFSPIVVTGANKTYALGSSLSLPSGGGVIIENANFIALSGFSGTNMQDMGLNSAFAANPYTYKNSHITWRNCTFDANHVAGVGCLSAKSFFVLTFDNCNFFRSPTYGLYTYTDGTEISHELKVRGCNLREWLEYEEPGFSTPGIRSGWGLRIQTLDVIISDTESGYWARPFYFLNCKGLTCTNFHPYGGHGYILGATTDLLDRVVFDNCYFDNHDMSVGNCKAIKFSDNTFYDAASKGQFITFYADSGSPDLNLIATGNDFTAPNHASTIEPYTFGGSLGTVYGYSQFNNYLDNVNANNFWGESDVKFDYSVGAFTPNPQINTNITSIGAVTKTRYTRIGRMIFYSFQILSVVPTATGLCRINFTPPVVQADPASSIMGTVHIFATADYGQVLDFSAVSDNVFSATVTANSLLANTWIINGSYSV